MGGSTASAAHRDDVSAGRRTRAAAPHRDDGILSLLARGDADGAATEVIRLHGNRVRGFLRGVLRDGDEADDAFSIFAEWTWRSIHAFRREAPVGAWALGIARNAARRVLVDPYRRRRAPIDVEAAGVPSFLEDDLAAAVRLERAARRVEAAAERLSAEERVLLGMRVEDRMPWNEISAVLARGGRPVKPPALRKRFERLKARIGSVARAGARAPGLPRRGGPG